MKPRIKFALWNIRSKKHQINQNSENKIFKSEVIVRRLWDNFKHSNICNMGLPGGEERARN